MEFTLNLPGNYPHVQKVEPTVITVVDDVAHRLDASFILGHDRIVEQWPVTDAAQLTVADMEPVLELNPEVVILGTGTKQVFPPAEVLATFLKRGIGIEAMENHAAARTHTILADEDRHVVAAFILSDGA